MSANVVQEKIMANSQRFQDRISENPNRRKLNIISQTPNTIIADIERADTVIGNQTGTPINAEMLNGWDTTVKNAESTAVEARTTANNAKSTADQALAVANNSIEDAAFAREQGTLLQAIATGFTESPDCSQANNIGVAQVELVAASNGQKKFAFKNIKGKNGDSVFVRYSYDKQSMSEEPSENSTYIGFYYGEVASSNASDYKWTRIWGTDVISLSEYKAMVTSGQVKEDQLYFIEGNVGDGIVVVKDASDVVYSNAASGLNSTNVQAAIDELKSREFSKSYNDLHDCPTIPNLSTITLSSLAEKSYNSLTDKPTIPTNASFTLAGLSEKSYTNLTDKPFIPTNDSFTLAGLSEKSYNSLTDKPQIPTVNFSTIASAMGLTNEQLTQLVELAKTINVSGDINKIVSFNNSTLNIQ